MNEETEVKKDKTWAMNQVNNLGGVWVKGKFTDFTTVPKDKVIRIISDMDEPEVPEVLSQGWLDENKCSWMNLKTNGYSIPVEKLQNLLVPNQEEVKIESVWAEDIEGAKASGMTLFETMDWMAIDCDDEEKQDLFARAWLDGYTVEEEQKYYAKVKGWGTNGNDGHVYYSGKFPLSLTMPTESVVHTKDEWRNYGVYEGNADFVLVEEMEK